MSGKQIFYQTFTVLLCAQYVAAIFIQTAFVYTVKISSSFIASSSSIFLL